MVTVIAKWKIKSDHVDTVLKLAEPLVESSRQEEGNQKYDLFIKYGTTDEVLIYEIYRSMKDFEFHKTTSYFKDIVSKITPLLETKELTVFED